MNFNNHSNLEGQHAFLGASKYHWINYGEDKVAEAYRNFLATQKRNRITCICSTVHHAQSEITKIEADIKYVCE